MKRHVICIDKDVAILKNLEEQLVRLFHGQLKIQLAKSASDALIWLEKSHLKGIEVPTIIFGSLISDTEASGLLMKINRLYPEIMIIVIVKHGEGTLVHELINTFDLFGYIAKPWLETDLLVQVKEALRRYDYEKTIKELNKKLDELYLEVRREADYRRNAEKKLDSALSENDKLKQGLQEKYINVFEEYEVDRNFPQIIGKSETLQYVLYRLEKVAPISTTVLILGETGTGKELVAQAIHNLSPRRDMPLVKVNCAALPSELIESELFGHEKGAFTGAYIKKVGKFERADRGTLFLDEIGELPMSLQAKILRAIESDEIERLGSAKTIKIDVRIIAATNRNLEEEIENLNFRSDLYYRINVFPVTLPPLRQRKEDIPLLVSYFIDIFNKKIGKKVKRVPQKVLDELKQYDWPGNIRELENIVERGMILSQGDELTIELPDHTKARKTKIKSLDEIEKNAIVEALNICQGKISGKSGAAQYLKINASTLRSKMKKLGIKKQASRFVG